jgi:hypothetical protein
MVASAGFGLAVALAGLLLLRRIPQSG